MPGKNKYAATPKRIAAAVLLSDLELLTGYWVERNEDLLKDWDELDIQDAMDAIIKPFEKRLMNIAKDVRAHDEEYQHKRGSKHELP